MLVTHLIRMAMQLVDSTVPTTREFWRRKFGLPEHVVTDPRPLSKIAKSPSPTPMEEESAS